MSKKLVEDNKSKMDAIDERCLDGVKKDSKVLGGALFVLAIAAFAFSIYLIKGS